jgi:putative flippase GtrA
MNPTLAQFLRFVAVGAIGTAAHYAVLIVGVERLGVRAVAASSAGALLGAIVNYSLNRRHTFGSERPHREALPRFMLIAALAFAMNALLMAALLSWHLHYLAAQIVTTGVVLLFNFLANRSWTFQTPRS